jgi:hypothetical protein
MSDDCYGDKFYYGWGRARDVKKALACYRASNDWMMLAILQINGEGAPVDIAGARASLNRVESKDADFEALDRIIKKREANPTAKFRRVDFCKDVANTTPSVDVCQAREEGKKTGSRCSSRATRTRGCTARTSSTPTSGPAWARKPKRTPASGCSCPTR